MIVSCSNEDLDRKDGPTVPEGLPVTLKLSVATPEVPVVETRAVENDDKTFGEIKNVAVLVYDEKGENPVVTYINGLSGTSAKNLSFDAKTGKHKIYVLANVESKGTAEMYRTETELLREKIEVGTITPSGEEMMLGCVAKGSDQKAMASSSEAYYDGGASVIEITGNADESFSARVIPPYSKITFNITKELQNAVLLSISEVSVHRCPKKYSFISQKWEYGDVEDSGEILFEGSTSQSGSDDDLGVLKEGVSFFMYENQQGVSSGSNNDPSKKAPNGLSYDDSQGSLSEWYSKWDKTPCTFIQVKGKYTIFTEESNGKQDVGTGDIYYRFFLGENATTDFNIKRNTHYNVTLAFTKKAGKEELEHEWRVYADLKHSTIVPEGTLEIDGSQTYFPFYIVNNSGKAIDVTTDVVGYSDMMLRYKDSEKGSWIEGYSDLGSNVPNGAARYCGVKSVNFGVMGLMSEDDNYYRENGNGEAVNNYNDNKDKRKDVVAGNIFRIRHFYIAGEDHSTLNVKEYPLLWLSGSVDPGTAKAGTLYVQRIDRPDGAVDKAKASNLCKGNNGSGLLYKNLPTLDEFKLMIQTETGPLKPKTKRAYWTEAGLYYWPSEGNEPEQSKENVGYVRCVYNLKANW